MLVEENGTVRRTLQEQVLKNKEDIENLTQSTAMLGVKIIGTFETVAELYTYAAPGSDNFNALEYGEAFAVGTSPFDYIYYTKVKGLAPGEDDYYLELKFLYTEGESAVTSVNLKTGDVVLSASDIKASNAQTIQQNLVRIDERIDDVDSAKLDKVTTTAQQDRVYVVKANGTQGTYRIDTPVGSGNNLVFRDGNGRAQIADPVANADIANKKYVDDHAGGGGSTVYEHHIYMYYEGGDDPCFFAEFDWYNSSATPYGSVYACFQDAQMANKWICGFSCDTWGAGTLMHDSTIGNYIKFDSTQRILTKVDDFHDDGWYSVVNNVHEPDISADHSQQWMSMLTFTDRVRALN